MSKTDKYSTSGKITKAAIPATIRPQRMIGEFYASVTISEVATDVLEVTQHPVQQGASITDHAYLKPAQVTISTVFGDEECSLSEVYDKLLKLQVSRIPIDVVTGKRIYKNMLIMSLSQSTDSSSEHILKIDFSLQEVILTAVEVVTVPPRERQRMPAQTSGKAAGGNKKLEEEPLAKETATKKAAEDTGTIEYPIAPHLLYDGDTYDSNPAPEPDPSKGNSD